MLSIKINHDAIIIGGGFYGVVIASYLSKIRGFQNIILLEREKTLLARASYNNQARVHNGYHYPRNFTTAYRSRINLPKFMSDWQSVVKTDFTKLYGIARRNSKITSKQFERFCQKIGAKIQQADKKLELLFEPNLIENVFLVEEFVFDSKKLAKWAVKEMHDCGIQIYFDTEATHILKSENNSLDIITKSQSGIENRLNCSYVFNCTYSGLNQLKGDFFGIQTSLKQEITEMVLLSVPSDLQNLGITIMDGSFFSLMPFPGLDLHTLSHVRYTPHLTWIDSHTTNPYQIFNKYKKDTRSDRMIRDAARYLPAMNNVKYIDSLFEVKTTLLNNDIDDGRPILFEKNLKLPHCYSILGGKIDNIYDVLEKLDQEQFIF